jgi:hypothetical protein
MPLNPKPHNGPIERAMEGLLFTRAELYDDPGDPILQEQYECAKDHIEILIALHRARYNCDPPQLSPR